jgi:hypothetical protein
LRRAAALRKLSNEKAGKHMMGRAILERLGWK